MGNIIEACFLLTQQCRTRSTTAGGIRDLSSPRVGCPGVGVTVSCPVTVAKFHYASWFEAGRGHVRSQIPLRRLVRSLSATSFEPVSNQIV